LQNTAGRVAKIVDLKKKIWRKCRVEKREKKKVRIFCPVGFENFVALQKCKVNLVLAAPTSLSYFEFPLTKGFR
jgi:hypothetical protein